MNYFDLISEGLHDQRPLLFFGAGQNASIWIENLLRHHKAPLAVIDETPSKQGRKICSVPIVSPECALTTWGKDSIVLSTIFLPHISFSDLKKKILSLGFANVAPISAMLRFFPKFSFYYFHGEPVTSQCREQIKKLLDHFVDPISIAHVKNFLEAQLHLDPSLTSVPRGEDYFLNEWINFPDQIDYVDAGAYQGDTIEKFFQLRPFNVSTIIGFEPDPINFSLLSNYVHTLKLTEPRIQLHRVAIGREKSKLKFQSLGNAASNFSTSGDLAVDVISLDETLDQHKDYFIKFDVEGAEMEALYGCKNIIRYGHSTIAVSVYHRAADLTNASEFMFKNFENCRLFF